jgi:hypothetical protein
MRAWTGNYSRMLRSALAAVGISHQAREKALKLARRMRLMLLEGVTLL